MTSNVFPLFYLRM